MQGKFLQHILLFFSPVFFSFLEIKLVRSYLCPSSSVIAASLNGNLLCTATALSCLALFPAFSSRLNKPSSLFSSQRLFCKPLISADVFPHPACTSLAVCCSLSCASGGFWLLPGRVLLLHLLLCSQWFPAVGLARIPAWVWGALLGQVLGAGARPPGPAEHRNQHVQLTPRASQPCRETRVPVGLSGLCPQFPGSGKSPPLSSGNGLGWKGH